MKKKTVKKHSLDQFNTQMITAKRRPLPAEVHLHPALGKHLGYCLYKAALKFRTMIDTLLSDQGLIAPQFGILNILKSTEGLNQISLGLQMGIDKATVVKLIDGLEKAGYVVRVSSETDRREKFLKVTPRGLKFLDQIMTPMKALETDFLSPLSAEEKRVLLAAIPKLMKPKKQP
jgi:DNA-binding MarR family transcriptional regulator